MVRGFFPAGWVHSEDDAPRGYIERNPDGTRVGEAFKVLLAPVNLGSAEIFWRLSMKARASPYVPSNRKLGVASALRSLGNLIMGHPFNYYISITYTTNGKDGSSSFSGKTLSHSSCPASRHSSSFAHQ